MSRRPLSDLTADELAEMVNIARQEIDVLAKKFGLGDYTMLQYEVVSYLAITVAVQTTIQKLQIAEINARPWYKRWIP